jgi:alkanesulfonate monooxygenase SsuD/methylene tetrahydromethanopterin reductase-like flavin-dependent oxidoreductase (luciferase family)
VIEFGVLLHTARQIRDDGVPADLSPVVAAIAAQTRVTGLGVVPLSAPLRQPVLLAHELSTIDVLSGGRLVIAPSIGKGGTEGQREFANCGVPFKERGQRLSEILQIMRLLWTEHSVTFQSAHYSLIDATIFPKPLHRPIPQLVATGRDERALRRAGRYGDGWFSSGGALSEFCEDREKVTSAALEAGRRAEDVAPTGLYVTIHLERDEHEALEEGPRHIERYFGTHPPRENNWFGSPSSIAARLQGFADAGLTMLAVRFVDDDLDKQIGLMHEALGKLSHA